MASLDQSCVFLVFIVSFVASQNIFDQVLGDVKPCRKICEETYAQHTYDQQLQLQPCQRGCRLFSIIEFADDIQDPDDVNRTVDGCIGSCQEAYPQQGECNACITGCTNQVPFAVAKYKMYEEATPSIHLLDSLTYMHNWCNSLMNSVVRGVSYSSAYIMQDNGQVVVLRAPPRVFTQVIADGVMVTDERKTSGYVESNLIPLDNSATPNLRSSQLRSMERDIRDLGFAEQANMQDDDSSQSDWLSCIARKSGIPRLMLVMTLFLSACFMVWLCFTTAATAPDQKVQSQKLSIYGDLEYLNELRDKALLAGVHPQEKAENDKGQQAPPLPIKIKMENV